MSAEIYATAFANFSLYGALRQVSEVGLYFGRANPYRRYVPFYLSVFRREATVHLLRKPISPYNPRVMFIWLVWLKR